VCVLMLESNL